MADENKIDFNKLDERQLMEIKSLASTQFVTSADRSRGNNSVFNLECSIYAFLCFLNSNGYEIVKKEVKDEQQI